MIQVKMGLGCFCITPEDSFKQADVIFEGIAHVDTTYSKESNCYFGLEGWVEFEVDTIIKGGLFRSHLERCKKIVILQGSTNCYFSFLHDSAYVVYAKVVEEEEDPDSFFPFLTTAQCTGTNKIPLKEITSRISAFAPTKETRKNQLIPYQRIGLLGSVLLNVGLLLLLLQIRRSGKQKSHSTK